MNQFVESIKRLYKDGKVAEKKIVELFESGKITEEEKVYILDVENVKNINLEVKPNSNP